MSGPETIDTDRNLDLAAAVSDIVEYITRRLAALTDQTGQQAEFHLIGVVDDMAEVHFEVRNFEMMASALEEQLGRWIEAGLIRAIDDEDEQLFTATFDPAKARLS